MWQGIYGHDRIVEQFRRSLEAGRLASSYLFLGPPGVGKRTFALQLAKAVLCTNSPEAALNPCGNCDSCRLIDAGTHPDVDVVGLPPGKRELPISTFLGDRDHRHQEGLCHNIGLRPLMGRRRVAIIDDADGLNTESANCLLKTLEEPPTGAVLILLGTNRSRQLPTILSRTQLVRFEPLGAEVVARLLVEQGIVQGEQEARELAEQSGGSLQRAVDVLTLNLNEYRPQLLRQFTGTSIDSMRLVSVVNDFVADAGTAPEAKRQRLRATFDLVTNHLRGGLRGEGIQQSPNRAPESRLLAALERCIQAEEELDRNANQATLLECWVDDLSRLLGPATISR
jgi:DNA polymerase III subunit delta'